MLLRGGLIALRHVLEELHMLGDMRAADSATRTPPTAVTGVDKTPSAWIAGWHLVHIEAHHEQGNTVRKFGDGVSIDTDVNGPGEQRKRARRMRMPVLCHQGCGT